MSSLSAENPTPFYSLYGATKAFTQYFCEAIITTYSHSKLTHNIDFLIARPYFI